MVEQPPKAFGVGSGFESQPTHRFELAPTIADLKDLVFGRKGGDDRFADGAGGAEDDDLLLCVVHIIL